jgi:hypothetical protein
VLRLLLPILAAIAAESHTTVDESHQLSSYPHGRRVGTGFDMLALALDENRQPSSYPHGRRVGIGFESGHVGVGSEFKALALGSRHSRWVQGVGVGKFEALALALVLGNGFEALALGMRHWRWVRGIGVGKFEVLV